ncbi:DNA methylase [Thalassoglobus neptunius]|uniref:DNA methylase n=1 Tax=Thalassoglobus neptunius TaxID=1938619 RepID=A0A5C5X7U1_9PLAN|nr:DNA methyltransferase [Thalassoglobus neptunius]TWT58984.1 DNA methylase [Thalassoglobus neptunius]
MPSSNEWSIHKGDCIPHMLGEMKPKSVDFSIYSPPFPSLYAYTSEDCDIGNTATVNEEAKIHLSFFFKGLKRVLKPGRVAICHCCQIPRMKRTGEVGMHDFRGMLIRLGERAGLVYEYDWSIGKNPQSQAIRTRSRELQFAGLESDRSGSRGTIQDYLIKFRAPGENRVPIRSKHEISRNDWINWAEGTWDWRDVIETDTLNTAAAKGGDDTRHICPLQLEVYRRCILLYTNPGELVFEPFGGIGSGGYVALGGESLKTCKRIENPRRYHCCEIKDEYIQQAKKNLETAIGQRERSKAQSLFAGVME